MAILSSNICMFSSVPYYQIVTIAFHKSELKSARVGFTCGPRVSKTGAAGAFMNKINMTNKHGKSNAATPNNDAHSSNKSDKVIENEAEI